MTLINVFAVFTCFHLLAVWAAPLVNLLEVDADGDGTGVSALRGFAAYATSDAVVTEADEPGHLSAADRLRALTPRPLPTSHVHGSDARTAFAAMNVHLTHTEPVQVAPCAAFTHAALNAVSRTLFALRDDELQLIYTNAADKRALHFRSIEFREELWDRGAPTDTMRDGKCAEAVMWYIHHLSQEQRQRLATVDDFVLPLMPEDVASIEEREAEFDGGSEYVKRVTCTSCHTHSE